MYAPPSTTLSKGTPDLDVRIRALADRVEYLTELRHASLGQTAATIIAEGKHLDSMRYLCSEGYARKIRADYYEGRMLRTESHALREARWAVA